MPNSPLNDESPAACNSGAASAHAGFCSPRQHADSSFLIERHTENDRNVGNRPASVTQTRVPDFAEDVGVTPSHLRSAASNPPPAALPVVIVQSGQDARAWRDLVAELELVGLGIDPNDILVRIVRPAAKRIELEPLIEHRRLAEAELQITVDVEDLRVVDKALHPAVRRVVGVAKIETHAER